MELLAPICLNVIAAAKSCGEVVTLDAACHTDTTPN